MEVSAFFLAPALLGLGISLAFAFMLITFLAGVETLAAMSRRRQARDYPEIKVRNVIYPGDRD